MQILRKYPTICQNSYYFCSQISYTALAFGSIFLATANVVVPVFMKGVSRSVQNYRPISLTCVASKIMERIVSDRIINHLLANNILHSAQHGFLKHRSTTTNLIECFNDWTVCVQDRCQMTVDFRKAFDVVSHEKLFHRLYHYGILL